MGKKLYLSILMPKYGRKFGPNVDMGGGEATLGRPYLPNDYVCMPPLLGGAQVGLWWGGIGKYYCRQKASISCSTPSQMCGSWYMPRFLFRGVLTLMNMPSLMVLVTPWDPIHYGEVVKFDCMTYDVDMVIDGR